jgi:hypothetical protein
MKINPSKRKKTIAKLLSFTYVYFSESGLFNGLRPIQIKNSRRFLRPTRNAPNACLVPFPLTSGKASADIPGTEKNIARIRYLGKDFDRLFGAFVVALASASVARSGLEPPWHREQGEKG